MALEISTGANVNMGVHILWGFFDSVNSYFKGIDLYFAATYWKFKSLKINVIPIYFRYP